MLPPLTPNSLLFIDCCSHVRLAMPLRNLDAKEVASLGRFMGLKPVFMPSFTTMSAPRTSLVGVTEGEWGGVKQVWFRWVCD